MTSEKYNREKFDKAVLKREATWWQMELPSGSVYFGDAKAEMLGFPEDNFKYYQDFTKLVHPDDYERIMSDMREHLDGKKPIYETKYRIKNKEGDYISFYDCGKIISQKNGVIKLMGFVWKIKEDTDIEKQMKDFRDLILGGEPSIVDIVSKLKI